MHSEKLALALLILTVSAPGLGCITITDPVVIIPPEKVDGEFTYVYPTESDEIERVLSESSSVAVVTVLSDRVFEGMWVAEIQLHYGWGFQKGRFQDFVRTETTCGKPPLLESNKRYVAILYDGEVARVLDFEKAQEFLNELGPPRYRYSNAGLTVNENSK